MARVKKTQKKDKPEREDKEEVKNKKVDRKKYEKQSRFIIFLMIIVFILFFIFFSVFKEIGTFTYEGIKFQKTTLGDSRIPIYHGKIFITRPGINIKFNLFLRNDPNTLENIDTNFSDVILRKFGFISFEPRISGCYGSSYASFRLAEFLSALGMHVKGATTDANLSAKSGIEWRTCDDAKNRTVIMLKESSSNVTSIHQESDCYIIDIAGCEVIPAVEKFILEIAIALKDRYR
jgi:hypothetical protein